MIIDDKKFEYEDIPNFVCPTCGMGILRRIDDSVKKYLPGWIKQLPATPVEYVDDLGQTIRSFSYASIEGTDHEYEIITFFLQCQRYQCRRLFQHVEN